MERRSSWNRITLSSLLVGLAALSTVPLSAQYTFRSRSNQSIIFETGEEPPDEESIRERAERAPWKPGALRLSPTLGFRDARFVTNRGSLIETSAEAEDRTDFTATFAAGLRAYLKTGEKVIFSAHALPEYVWWQDDRERRRVNGRYGAAVFGFFNRLTVEASHRLVEEQSFFSPEVEQLATVEVAATRLYSSVEISRGVFFFASASRAEFSAASDEAQVLRDLDRERETLRAGLRFATRGGWTLGLGYEDGSVEFPESAVDRSNDATAELLELTFEGNRFELDAAVAFRSLEPRPGSSFVATDETTGDASLRWQLDRHFSLSAYALQELSFSVLDSSSHFLSRRQGLIWSYDSRGDRRRVTFDLFFESGEDEFTAFAAGGPDRTDDAETYGGSISFYLSRNLQLSVGGLESSFDSTFDPEDRDLSTFGVNLVFNFTDALDRIGLRLGSSGGSGW